MSRKTIAVIGMLLILASLLVGKYVLTKQTMSSGNQGDTLANTAEPVFQTMTIDDQQVTVEIADTPAKQQQGLSDRSELGSDGMLFPFGSLQRPSFWMKGMQFDLDFIWIAGGEVGEIMTDIPKPLPNTPLNQLPTYQPDDPVDAMVEMEAGKAVELGIEVGDKVHFVN